MSDWEEESESSDRQSLETYIPPRGRGWGNENARSNQSDKSDTRRPGFGRGRSKRFDDSINGGFSPVETNGFSAETNFRRFGSGGRGFMERDTGESRFSQSDRRDNTWRRRGREHGYESNRRWNDQGNRERFGRSRVSQESVTEIMVPSTDVRFIIGGFPKKITHTKRIMCTIGGLGRYIGRLSVDYRSTINR